VKHFRIEGDVGFTVLLFVSKRALCDLFKPKKKFKKSNFMFDVFLSWTAGMNLSQSTWINWKELLIQMILHFQSFMNNFNRIKSISWFEKTSSRRYLSSLIAFQRRRMISKHSMNIFQRISDFVFIIIIFKSIKLFLLNENQRIKSN
jgi:hypothetical protein